MNAPIFHFDEQRSRCLPLVRAVAALIAIAFALTALPGISLADGYSMDDVRIDAAVTADGSLNVTESRTFKFDDDVNGVYWLIPLGENQQGGTVGVTVTSVSSDVAYTQVDAASNGDTGVYTVSRETEDGTDALKLKVFSPHEDGDSTTITVSYVMTGAVMSWPDTAELYWKFIGDGWSESSNSVTALITFAGDLATATPATKGENFRAWGHGPLTGDVALDATAPSVTYSIPRVRSGEYAEARIAFPSAWVPGLAASSEERLPTILKEEKQWADEANARREQARRTANVMAGVTVAAAAIFTGAVVALRATRRNPRPLFQDEYFRDVPSADHPAALSYFMEGGPEVPDRAFTASLMKLTDDRVVSLERAVGTKKGAFGREKQEETYSVTLNVDKKDVADEIDRAVLDLFFAGSKRREDGTRVRTFAQFQRYAKDHTEKFGDKMDDYKAAVKAAVEERDLVASSGVGAIVLGLVIGIIVICLAVGMLFYTDFAQANVIAAAIAVPVAIVGIVVSFTFRRYTPEGAELAARCRALKHWLEDFTRLKEAVPGDLVLWNKLMVMGVALGVSRETIRELADAVPRDMRESDDFYYYYPGYWWYYGADDLFDPAESLGEAYHASIRELASSSDSSGGGLGGGFSGGGGGGVGGGGGGTF